MPPFAMTVEARLAFELARLSLLHNLEKQSQGTCEGLRRRRQQLSNRTLYALWTVPLEKSDGMLPSMAPADEQTKPTNPAMINSKGHRLCEVGSVAVSTTTRARTAAGTAAPMKRIVVTRRVLANERTATAKMPTTSRPGPYNASGSETFA